VPNFAINTAGFHSREVNPELAEAAAFTKAENIQLEITDFASPDVLDTGLSERVDAIIKALNGVTPRSSHGPFLDLTAASKDREIVAVCRKRHEQALGATAETGAKIYVAHTNFNSLIRNKAYRNLFVERSLKFWLPLADWAGKKGITIVLENLWEEGPEVQRQLADSGKHPHLKASFDNGHALVFSKRPASQWTEVLGEALAHCHLHDNDGEEDRHWPVGKGKEAWPALVSALQRYAPGALLVVESDRLALNKESLQKLRELWK